MISVIEGLVADVKALLKRVSSLEARRQPTWVFLTTPKTSTSWDGDAYSTTAKTLIDLSAVFGVPAGVKAILAKVVIRDSASDGANDNYLVLSPNSNNLSGIYWESWGRQADKWETHTSVVPCNVDGDVYYQILATGSGTMDVNFTIWGYLI